MYVSNYNLKKYYAISIGDPPRYFLMSYTSTYIIILLNKKKDLKLYINRNVRPSPPYLLHLILPDISQHFI